MARVALALKLLLFLGPAVALVRGQAGAALYCLAALALSLTPGLVARSRRTALPAELDLTVSAALAVGAPLGVGLSLFQIVPGLDALAHLLGGAALGCAGFVLTQRARLAGKIAFGPWLPAAQAILWALSAGAAWEIGEAILDRAGWLMQPGLTDSMTDLMADWLGGLLAAWWGISTRAASRRGSSGSGSG